MRIGNSGVASYLDAPEERFARIKELSYDAVEECINDTNAEIYHDVAAMEAYCARVRKAAESQGIEIWQVHGPWPTDDKSEESRRQVWDYMHRAVYGCYLMGAKYLIIHPQMPYGWGCEEDPDFAEKLTVDLMRDLMPDCEKYGVTLCLENMPMTAHRISTMERIVEAVKQVDSPNIGVCLDTGHVNVFPGHDLGDAVRVCAPYLRVVHVHDNNGERDQHLLPYLGTANWDSFVEAMAEIDFSGVLSFETAGPVSPCMPAPVLRQAEQVTVETVRYMADAIEQKKKKK